MSCYAVVREAGPGWTDGGIDAQAGLGDHAAFMNALASDGTVLLAGPVAGTERGRLRVLLILDAGGEDDIRRRLADDPWVHSDRLRIASIESWDPLVGKGRLAVLAR